MKKLFLLTVLFWAGVAVAEVELSPAIQKARAHRAELVQKQDELLDLLLQVPFEQRQYIFPLLSAKQSVPKKIKTHPEVLVWKGKRPTRIADRFKNDEELLQYLPEQFYNFLSPDMWPPEGEPMPEMNPNQLFQNILNNQTNGENISVMPEELVDIYDGLNILQTWVKQQGNQPEMPLVFEKWTVSAPTEVGKEIQEKTGLDIQKFSTKLDKIAKSYRMYQKQKVPPASEEQKLVQEYWSLIPFIFQKAGFSEAIKPDNDRKRNPSGTPFLS